MYFLSILFIAILWASIWFWVVKGIFFFGKKIGRLAPNKNYKWIRRGMVFIFFFTPFYSSYVTTIYRHITFPILCSEMAGYQKLNPVRIDGLYTEPGLLDPLIWDGIQFVEWEIPEKYTKKYNYQPALSTGLYRVELKFQGHPECELYYKAIPASDTTEMRSRDRCFGIAAIKEPKAQFQYVRTDYLTQENLFKYLVSVSKYKMVNRFSGEIVSQYNQLVTRWPGALKFMLEGQGNVLWCPDPYPVRDPVAKFFILRVDQGGQST